MRQDQDQKWNEVKSGTKSKAYPSVTSVAFSFPLPFPLGGGSSDISEALCANLTDASDSTRGVFDIELGKRVWKEEPVGVLGIE